VDLEASELKGCKSPKLQEFARAQEMQGEEVRPFHGRVLAEEEAK
jgi:hypothetical protein